MLVEILNVTLADLIPVRGVAVSLPGEPMPHLISERLHSVLKNEASKQGAMVSVLLCALRDELHSTN